MKPRLIALSGPLRGSVFALGEDPLTIGREQSNRVRPEGDLSVSRQHCRIEVQGDEVRARDLGSYNGTFVNGVPIAERRLSDGDRLLIGESCFLFLTREAEPEPDLAILFDESIDEGSIVGAETLRLLPEENSYFHPLKSRDTPPSARRNDDLQVLLHVSTALGAARTLENMAREMFEPLFAAVPAERGALLLGEEPAGDDRFTEAFGWESEKGATQPAPPVSRTILGQVLADGAALLCRDVRRSSRFSGVESLASQGARSLIAAPLLTNDRRRGVLYLSASDPAHVFDQDDLQLVSAVAGIAALAVDNIRRLARLEDEFRRLGDELRLTHSLVGESAQMREVYDFISRVAPTDSTVLIRGESGTGKELAARALHLNGPRASKPFVAINCAAINEMLLESELFGHEKGAFTGAVAQKKGKIEIAEGGTLFLDEIGEMSPALQAKLLRVLQEREFERVGGLRPIRVDVRIIAATHRDIEAMIRQGNFRQDLYYRLNVVSLRMPPLRSRREDIPLLARHFTARYAERCHRPIAGISPEADACLRAYDWPGNVRELENAIERAVVLGGGENIRPEDLPEAIIDSASGSVSGAESGAAKYHEALQAAKRAIILDAAAQTGGNLAEAARWLGVHPNYLYRLVRHLGLRDQLKK
ncbi:MAG: sigma 54-interacting transcriptional regulator [Acidobacteria bacterium]|nr:sigma 54-interacting transcriptional regulator [Acidobacteriota bacterium]